MIVAVLDTALMCQSHTPQRSRMSAAAHTIPSIHLLPCILHCSSYLARATSTQAVEKCMHVRKTKHGRPFMKISPSRHGLHRHVLGQATYPGCITFTGV